MKVTVLGARQGPGRAICVELAERGHEVTAVTRDGRADVPVARTVAADLADEQQARAACRGADVVVMAASVAYPAWYDQLWPLMSNALEAAVAAQARLVVVDNLYAYGVPDGPISASSPETPGTRKGDLRRDLGRRLLAAHQQGRTGVSLGRFSDYYGPGAVNAALHMLAIRPGLRGRTARGLGALDQPHTFAYLPDAARGFATLVEHERADGSAWVLPAAPALTQRQLLDLVVAELPAPVRTGCVRRWMVRAGGLVQPMLRETVELLDQFERPYITDGGDFEAAFGPVAVTPHPEAIATTVAAERGRAAAAGNAVRPVGVDD